MGLGSNSPDKAPTPQASSSTSWELCDWGDTSTCSEGQTEHTEHRINASPSAHRFCSEEMRKKCQPLEGPCQLPLALRRCLCCLRTWGSPQGSLLLSSRTTYCKAQPIFREPGKKAGCVAAHSLPWKEMLVTREAGWKVERPPLPLLALWPPGEWQAGDLGLGRMFADWGPAPQRAPPSYTIHSCVPLLGKRE